MPLKTYKVEYEWKIGGGGVDEVKANSAEEAREEFIAEAPYRVKRIRVTEVKDKGSKENPKTDTPSSTPKVEISGSEDEGWYLRCSKCGKLPGLITGTKRSAANQGKAHLQRHEAGKIK